MATRESQMTVLFDVWLLMHLTSGLLDGALADVGLSADDYGLYSLLRGFGPATPTQIARWTGMRPTTVSAGLRRMAGRGHAVQAAHPDDGRSYRVALSPAGLEAHAEAARAFRDVLGQVHAALGPALATERAGLQRLDGALRAVCGLSDRPYHVADEAPGAHALAYDGPPLTPDQEQAARAYVDFLRTPPRATRRRS